MTTEPNPPFNLSKFLSANGTGKSIVRMQAGQSFFDQGDRADAVYYLQRGTAKVVVVSGVGHEAVVGTVAAGDFFGEQALTGHERRVAAVIAMGNCSALKLPKEAVLNLLQKEQSFSDYFISYLLSRSSRMEADLIDHLFNSSEKRLARVLLLLANFGKEAPPEPVLAKINQETLAQMIGTTRSRVSSFMNKFRRLGFIEYNGDLVVNKSLLSVVLRDNGETDPDTPSSSR